eukprot:SAG22_NODE_2303_length_2736_cov_4.228669_3_plen_135_part_00
MGLFLGQLLFTSVDAAPALYIYNLHVSAAARGQGVGHLLMAAAFARAKRWGCTKLYLECEATNTAARALYKRFGIDERGGDLADEHGGVCYTRLFYGYPADWLDDWTDEEEDGDGDGNGNGVGDRAKLPLLPKL